MFDDRVQRERQGATWDIIDRIPAVGTDCAPADLLTTTTVLVYPSDANAFYAGHPTYVNGGEVEGDMPSFWIDTAQLWYALNVGNAIPPVGTQIVVHATAGRWIFQYDGPA
jgi:hypothetical protein